MEISDKSLVLYNTLSRKEEPVQPIQAGHLNFYACGPTVYSYAHIGNFRSFLTADLIFRTARALGLEVTYVTNITDVGHLTEDDRADAGGEDRMAKALRSKEGEHFANIWDLARYYTQILIEDWHQLNMLEPTVRPRATQHIREQIQAVEKLLSLGYAYETPDAIYFDVSKFEDYGKLSGNTDADSLNEAVRDIVQDSNKKHHRDFALWKKDEKHLMQWYSPWGWGFPGWHIECSVMANAYLGETIDIHAGGEDLIFPHHECEIAQAESLSDKPFANHWVHTRFLLVEGEKMAKSKNNFLKVRDLLKSETEGGEGLDPLVLRYELISGHYRKQFNFTHKSLKDSAKIVRRFKETFAMIEDALNSEIPDGKDFLKERLDKNYEAVLDAMRNDLNTPMALAKALEGVKMINGVGKNLNQSIATSARQWFENINHLLGFIWHESPVETTSTTATEDTLSIQVEALLVARKEARQNKNYARADAIREELDALGVEVMDTPEGTKWRKKL